MRHPQDNFAVGRISRDAVLCHAGAATRQAETLCTGRRLATYLGYEHFACYQR